MNNTASRVSLKGFIIVSLLIALSDAVFVWINARSDWENVLETTREEASHVQSSFFVALDTIATNMQAIATYVASDSEIARLFFEGKKAVQSEGGGAGGARAALARQKLYAAIRPGWKAMQGRYEARQLHFHLGPGSTSFLRAHRPEKFGDNMDEVRYTVVDVNADGKPTKGFETGRVYSGIRGVVPVWFTPENQSESIQVGALEVGASFSTLLNSLQKAFNAQFTVFLTQKHMEDNMWPDFLRTRYKKTPPVQRLIVESSTDPDIYKLLDNTEVQKALLHNGTRIIDINGEHLALSTFEFQDYKLQRDNTDEAVGRVLFLYNIDTMVASYYNAQQINIIFALLAFVFVEILLFYSWRWASSGLQTLVDKKTRELGIANQSLRHEVEQRRNAEHKYKSIFDNVPIGIFQSTADGKYLTANRELARIYGYDSVEELLENIKNLRNDIYVHPEKFDEMQSLLQKEEEIRGFESLIKRRDGQQVWTSRSVRRFMNGENLVVFDGFVRDITDHKKLEQLKEDIERITRHDLKSPIIGVVNGASLLEMEENLDEQQTEVVNLIKEQAYLALDMINRSLVLYKIEQGGYKLQLEQFDLCRLFRHIEISNRKLSQLLGSRLEIYVQEKLLHEQQDSPEGCEIYADRGLCYAIFSNLVRNAFEATKDSSPVQVYISHDQNGLTVKVHNNSLIPEEIRQNFFDKYATYGKSGGTGLGTYSARLMVDCHGGTIDFSSEQGQGTTLSVRLPLQSEIHPQVV